MRPDLEKLGLFYLGRAISPESREATEQPILYDSRDLTTHGVIIGMTGSGKTGFGLSIIEEAAIDGIPVIAIDPKGDVGNLLLSFPELAPADFEPWVARGVDAAQEATTWKDGLAAWHQDGERIRRMRDAADFALYTPGSSAGRQLSVLHALTAPPEGLDQESLTDRASTAASSVLALAGIDADPMTSREHILLATLFLHAWTAGRALDLTDLIAAVQTPPFARVGVIDLETFFPAKDRTALSLRLNNLIASPAFAAWTEGEPMNASNLLYADTGKPRVSIVSIAHLSDAERMFAVSSLLSEIVTWVRAQSGTTSLRALLYFDEVFGYLPPVANPPSKAPLLTLLKQARASGVGVLLATQNPVDLDYKGLANAGTWFLGRLQTERDKARLLDGLEAASGAGMDRPAVDAALSSLGKRQFLLHNVHAKQPVLFESRWALSYLRGPLTREDIKRLTPDQAPDSRPQAPDAGSGLHAPGSRTETARGKRRRVSPEGARPILASDIPQLYLARAGDDTSAYQPHLYGSAQLFFGDSKFALDEARRVNVIVPLEAGTRVVDWDRAQPIDATPQDLLDQPPVEAPYAPLPSFATSAQKFAKLARDFDRWLGRTQRLELFRHAGLKMTSRPGEPERDFLIRVRDAVHEKGGAALDKLRRKWETKLSAARERVRRAEARVSSERQDVQQSTMQTTVSFGATILGAVLGRRGGGLGTLGRATTAARGVGRSMRERQQVERAEETLAAERDALASVEAQAEADLNAAVAGADIAPEALEKMAMRPRRGGTTVDLVAVVWK